MYLLVTNNFGIQIMQYLCFENLFIMQYPDQFVVQQADLMSPWQPLHGQARDDESQKWTVCLNQASDVHVRKLRPLMHELGLQLQVTLLNRTCRPGPVPSTTRVVLLVQYPVSHSKEKTHAHMHGMHMQWCGPRSPGSWYLCAGRPHTCSSAAPCFIGGRQPAGRMQSNTKWTNEWTVSGCINQIICTTVTEGVSIMQACQPAAAVTLWPAEGGIGCSYIHERTRCSCSMLAHCSSFLVTQKIISLRSLARSK